MRPCSTATRSSLKNRPSTLPIPITFAAIAYGSTRGAPFGRSGTINWTDALSTRFTRGRRAIVFVNAAAHLAELRRSLWRFAEGNRWLLSAAEARQVEAVVLAELHRVRVLG